MLADNLYVCVSVALISISGGLWLLKVAGVVTDLRHQSNIETIGIILLFSSWLPTTNAAWITRAVSDHRIRELVAETKRAGESQIAAQISEPGYVLTVAEFKTKDGHQVTVNNNGRLPLSRRGQRSQQPAVATGRYPVSVASGHAGTTAVPRRKLPVSTGTDGTVSVGRGSEKETRAGQTF